MGTQGSREGQRLLCLKLLCAESALSLILAISSHIFTSDITSDGRGYNGQVKAHWYLVTILPTDNTQGFIHVKPVCLGTYSELLGVC